MRIIVFDCETTGLLLPSCAPLEKQPRIIEFGAVVVWDTKIERVYNQLINPGQEISAEITKITGIKNEDLADKPAFAEVVRELEELFAGCDIGIAHNAPFDVGMLTNELKRIGNEIFPWPAEMLCSVQEHKHIWGRRMKLTELYEKFVGKPLAQTHRASDDAMALYEALKASGFFEQLGA